jgi:hypothetical protein
MTEPFFSHEDKLRLTAELAKHRPENPFTQMDLWAKDWDPLTHPEHSFKLLAAMSKYGVDISIDDFGGIIHTFSSADRSNSAESDDPAQNLRTVIFGAAVAIAIANQEGLRWYNL